MVVAVIGPIPAAGGCGIGHRLYLQIAICWAPWRPATAHPFETHPLWTPTYSCSVVVLVVGWIWQPATSTQVILYGAADSASAVAG